MFAPSDSSGGGVFRRNKWIVIVLAIALVCIIGLVIYLVINSKSFDVKVKGPESFVTTTGTVSNADFEISANMPVKNVYYHVTRLGEQKAADDELQEVLTGGKSNEAKIKIPKFKIEPGDSILLLHIESNSGKYKELEYPMNFDMGYSEPYEEGAVLQLEEGTKLISNELMVHIKEGTSDEDVEKLLAKYGAKEVGRIYMFNEYQLRFENAMDRAALNNLHDQLEKEDVVESATYNLVLDAEVETTPNDGAYDSWDVSKPDGNNWGLEAIDAPGAWKYNDEMKPVKVGVLDSIVNPSHEDLKIPESHLSIMPTNDFKTLPELVKYKSENSGMKFVGRNDSFADHGSHVSGIVGAISDNKKGVSGVDWFSDLYFSTYWNYSKETDGNVKVGLDSYASFTLNIMRLVASGCRVINVSIGSSSKSASSPEEAASINEVYDRYIGDLEEKGYDFLICKSAGNEGDDAAGYLLNRIMASGENGMAHTIVVGSIRPPNIFEGFWEETILDGEVRYKKAANSNFGDIVNLDAPGVDILSTMYKNSDYGSMSGTSMASPTVAGVVSLLYSINSNFKYDYVKLITLNSAEDWILLGSDFRPM
jgi:hypothetical protein